ncbi:MAG: DMT family transporter [Chloroflexi bacterium]|nr:DMT family transporter [Chloroflexota bacterium]
MRYDATRSGGPAFRVRFAPVTADRSLSVAARGSLLILAGTASSGLVGPFLSLLYATGFSPLAFAVWRGIIGGGVLVAVVLWQRRRDPAAHPIVLARLTRHERLMLAALVGCNIFLNTAFFVAIDTIPIGVALLLFYTYPLMLAVYGRLTGSERIGPAKVLALALGLGGLALVLTATIAGSETLNPAMVVLMLLSAVAGALWVVCSKSLMRVPAEQAMAISLLTTIVAVGGVMAVLGQVEAIAFPIRHLEMLPALAVLAIVSGSASATLFMLGVRLIGRVRAGILGLSEPIVGTAAAAIVIGQVLAPVQLLGGALVLAAAVLIQRTRDDPVAAEPALAQQAASAP